MPFFMQPFFNYNGRLISGDTRVISMESRGFRFGESIFETMKLVNGVIRLFDLHMDRLFHSLRMLELNPPPFFTPEQIRNYIGELASKNAVQAAGRVQLTLFRKEGGLYDAVSDIPDFLIEVSPLPDHYSRLNENGFIVDIAPDVRKATGWLSNLKSGNYLPYIQAARYARKNHLNECLILNDFEHVVDSSIFNFFLISNGKVYTPALSDGPVAGVMRRNLLSLLPQHGFEVSECHLTIQDMEAADELFLTNALYGLRWIKAFRGKTYSNTLGSRFFSWLLQQNADTIV